MHPPDPQEKRLRFGCGFVAGLVAALLSSTVLLFLEGYSALAFCLGVALVFGLLAMQFGDRFWFTLGESRWWFWW